MTIVTRNNINIVGSGPQTLVFAHGFGSDQTSWRKQIDALKDNFRMVAFDHVGCGHSDMNAYSPYRYGNLFGFAEDLLEICQELKIKDAIYIGHSVGGMVGILASQMDKSLFRKLILLGASPRYLNDGAYVGGFEQSDLNGLYDNMASNFYNWAGGFAPLVMGNLDRPELAQEFADTLKQMRPDIALQIARVIYESDHRAALPSVNKPTLILQSSADIAVPITVGEYMRAKIPNSTYKLLNATGHLAHVSAPDQVTASIREFIN